MKKIEYKISLMLSESDYEKGHSKFIKCDIKMLKNKKRSERLYKYLLSAMGIVNVTHITHFRCKKRKDKACCLCTPHEGCPLPIYPQSGT